MTGSINDVATTLNKNGPFQLAFAQGGPTGIVYTFTLLYEKDKSGDSPSITDVSDAARFDVGGREFNFASTDNGEFDTASASGDTVTFFSKELKIGDSKTGTVVIDYGSDVNQNTEVKIYTYLTINGTTKKVGVVDPPANQGAHITTLIDVLADGGLRTRNVVEHTGTTSSGQSSDNHASQQGGSSGPSGGQQGGFSGPSGGQQGGGGCLIATAAFGSELSPEVQYLRNFRDHYIFSTMAGSNFMNVFNTWYYSFSPYVADYERQQPWFQESVRILIYPLLGALSISEKAYSLFPGEAGAIIAGLVASSIIGMVYVSPLLLAVEKVKKAKFNYRIAICLVVAVVASVIFSLVIHNQTVIMFTTSLLVLTTIAISSIFFVRICVNFVLLTRQKITKFQTR